MSTSIQRIAKPHLVTLESALSCSKGSTLDGITEMTVLSVAERKTGSGDNGPWSLQRLAVNQKGIKADVDFWGFPDLSFLKGAGIALESTVGSKDKIFGVYVDEYKGARRIKVSAAGLVDFLEDKRSPESQPHNIAAHDGSALEGEAQTRQPAERQRPDRREDRQEPEARQGCSSDPAPRSGSGYTKKPIFGATVGMAINQANAVLIASGGQSQGYFKTSQYSRDLYQIASDILRVASKLESGDLALSPRKREMENTPKGRDTEEQRRSPEPEAEPGLERNTEPSFNAELADDEIPF